ncbi:MAG: TRAP transporter small permease subunit [Alphaproteobacteria bacterium]|nr:TRAP transporter small permease subunit [Alphaproteobacteria bacterium]
MSGLMQLSRLIDRLNALVGRGIYWFVLAAVLVSSINATIRYSFHQSSNAWLELQWYLFAAVFLLGAGYTLLHNEHIRIDVVNSHLSRRTQIWIDIFGTILFLLPFTILIMYLSWPIAVNSIVSNEQSSDAGGLVRWPARLLVPVGFFLLVIQALSELIKRIAFLTGDGPDPLEKKSSHGATPESEHV